MWVESVCVCMVCRYRMFIVWCSGKQRSKREAELNTNRPNPGGHERKILTKLMNAEKNSQAAASSSSRDKS